MKRYTSSFLLTATIYLFGFGLFAYIYESTPKEDMASEKHTTRLRICMSKPQTNHADTIEKSITQKPKKTTKQPTQKKEIATVKKQIRKKQTNVQTKKRVTTVTKKIPIIKEEEQALVQKKFLDEKLAKELAEKKAQEAEQKRKMLLAQQALKEAQEREKAYAYKCQQDRLKKEFTATLISKINANKSYPSTARRRAIEGDVKVRFKILADGNVDNIEITSGKSIFARATIEAIERSFPLNIKNSPYSLPEVFSLTITYRLVRS